MAMLMRVVAPPETWSSVVERNRHQHDIRIGLKLTYRRPRSLVAQHAFGLLVSELCDAGAVEWMPAYAREMLVLADPPGNLIDPQPKPSWLSIPDGKALGRHPTKEWMAAVEEALPDASALPGGGMILAELTRVAGDAHDRASESRLSVIGHAELPFHGDREPTIHELWHKERYLARDYPVLWRFEKAIPITVIAGGSLLTDVRFVALNPHIGLGLGWTPVAEGSFRWVDPKGAVMAESIQWAVGNIEAHDTSGYEQRSAEGWLVVASEAGWQAMRPRLAHFVRHRATARLIGSERAGGQELRAAVDKVPI